MRVLVTFGHIRLGIAPDRPMLVVRETKAQLATGRVTQKNVSGSWENGEQRITVCPAFDCIFFLIKTWLTKNKLCNRCARRLSFEAPVLSFKQFRNEEESSTCIAPEFFGADSIPPQ